jgi:hypothetical protein
VCVSVEYPLRVLTIEPFIYKFKVVTAIEVVTEILYASPDLVERMQNNWPLAESDRTTYYGVSGSPEKGYTDYPNYEVK